MSSGKITELAGIVGWLIGYVISMHLVAYIVSYLCYPHPVTVVCDCTRHPGRVKTSSALVRDF
jgi:hypothetical protein